MGDFPATMFSAVLSLKTKDTSLRHKALERILSAYYKPVYKHLRLKWRKTPEEAEEIAQDFFARAVERDIFALYDPTRGRFRTFVRTCLDNLVHNARDASLRLKRGGGLEGVVLEAHEAEREIGLSNEPEVDAVFDREWRRNLFERSVRVLEERLVAMDKRRHFEAFKRYDLHDGSEQPTYSDIAAELGIKVTDVTNYLHATRKELRAIVLETLRELTATEDEYREEAKLLLGVDV
jgi:RNA polymerase sigma factor (sigma-70 family)